jgi:hypothetical protein
VRVYSETYEAFFEITNHALLRGAQRALDELDLEAVLRYGRPLYENRALKIFLGNKESERLTRKRGYREMATHLRGITIVAVPAEPGVWRIATVYRNNHPKFRISPGRPEAWRRRARNRRRGPWH